MQSLVNEGYDKLDNVVSAIHAEFKDVLDGIKKSDIIDIIAGVHDGKKEQTRNEKAATIRLLQREAKLIKELENLKNGVEKIKSESKKNKTNIRIDELKRDKRYKGFIETNW